MKKSSSPSCSSPGHPRPTILHLDAHPDLYDAFEGDCVSHACPFARILEERLATRLVQVGIRAMTGHQRDQAARFKVEIIDMRAWAGGSCLILQGPVYLSLDLDALDPACAPGVSHPEPGGLTVRDALGLIQAAGDILVGADIVELNPLQDVMGLTSRVAAKCVKEIAGTDAPGRRDLTCAPSRGPGTAAAPFELNLGSRLRGPMEICRLTSHLSAGTLL